MAAIVMESAPWVLDVLVVAFILLLVAAFDLLAIALCRSAARGDRQMRSAMDAGYRVDAPLEPLNVSRARRRQVRARQPSGREWIR